VDHASRSLGRSSGNVAESCRRRFLPRRSAHAPRPGVADVWHRRHAANQRPKDLHQHQPAAVFAGARFARQPLRRNLAGRAEPAGRGRGEAKPLPRVHHAFRPRIHGARRRPDRPGFAAPIRRHEFRPREPGGPGRRTVRSRFHYGGKYFAGRASGCGRVRHAARLLDGAIGAGFVDRRRQFESQRDKYSDRPRERRSTAAGVYGFGRRKLLSRTRGDGDQRQHHHIADRRFHRHDPAFRHQHGLPVRPGGAAAPARLGGLRRADFLVGRARRDGQLAQSFIRWRMGRFRQRPPARMAARSDVRRGREQGIERRDLGRRLPHHRQRNDRQPRHDRAVRHGRCRRQSAVRQQHGLFGARASSAARISRRARCESSPTVPRPVRWAPA
jgi:hypothetical protein